MHRILSLALVLFGLAAASDARADAFGGYGVSFSVTPGHKTPVGVGLELEVGDAPWGVQGGPFIGGSGFFQVEIRGFSAFRATVGARALFLDFVGPCVGVGYVGRKKGGPGMYLEGGANLTGNVGVVRARVDTMMPFNPRRAPELGGWEGKTFQETSYVLSAGINPFMGEVSIGGGGVAGLRTP